MSLKAYLQKKLFSWIVHDVFNTLTSEDILRITEKGGILYRGQQLSHEMVDKIKQDAKFLDGMDLLKLIFDDVEYQLVQAIGHKGKTVEDIMTARVGIWVVNELKEKIKTLKNL